MTPFINQNPPPPPAPHTAPYPPPYIHPTYPYTALVHTIYMPKTTSW